MSSAVETSLIIREPSEDREPNSKRFLHSGRNDRSLHQSEPSSTVRLTQSLDGSRLVGLRSKTSLYRYRACRELLRRRLHSRQVHHAIFFAVARHPEFHVRI